MDKQLLNMLCLTGGGFRGLYTIEVIRQLEIFFDGKSIKDQCDCIVGTSIGGILSLGLALGKSSTELSNAFKNHKLDIFEPKRFYHSWLYSCKYKNAGLKKTIKVILGSDSELTMKELKDKSGVDVMIPTVEMSTGKTLLINTVENKYQNWKLIDVALATSAAPTFFPAHSRADERYLDGGISCNMPDLLAAQIYSVLRAREIDDLQILSIGTGSLPEDRDRTNSIKSNAGGLSWAKNLDYFINLQDPLVQAQCKAIFAKHRYARINAKLDFECKLDNVSDKVEEQLIKKAELSTSKDEILRQNAINQFFAH
ncbi:CBASS cGAMP-activated phospholipase [Shewanella frigidimarina]|uniref:CBASS cGAMP-activated phospholipase n=1 Tax=Shewanella frigidimarina TaxID=56812 RepID=UPI003D7AB4C3